jgi:hypothetical protein
MAAVRIWFALALVVAGCAEGTADAHEGRVSRGACYAALEPTLAAWTTVLDEHVRPECMALLKTYRIELVAQADMPCDLPGTNVSARGNRNVNGCTKESRKTIYLLDGMNDADTVDVAVHEWVHAIAGCENGDPDKNHVDPELWDADWSGVLGLGRASSPLGPCL